MTAPTIDETREDREGIERHDVAPDQTQPPRRRDAELEEPARPPIPFRPLLAAALSTVAAGLVSGGIFGMWSARLLGAFAAVFGVLWAWLTLRSRERETTYQFLLVPASLAIGGILLIPAGGGGPSAMPQLMRDAVASGRLLRPPVPFDPGWYPIVVVVFALLGFAAAWVGTALERPRLAVAVPLPILALTAITQPDEGEFIAGLCALVPLLAALAVLFGGDTVKASELTKDFELKRALRGVLATAAALVALVALSNATFLFPEPVFDPSDQPQKPKPIPLSQIEDRVLFEIKTEAPITGPWKTGVLDVYDGTAWRLPPVNKERLVDVPPDGVVNPTLAANATETVEFTVRNLGDASTLPATPTPARFEVPPDLGAKFDPRTDVLRMPEGRVPQNVTYTVHLPPYPDADALREAPPPVGEFSETLEIPRPPAAIQRILEEAPPEPGWERLDFVRQRLRDVVVAVGGGVPGDIEPKRVAEIFNDPEHEASPYEIVAAEAMLARWAGVPARIGFGFDGLNDEDGVLTVRPRNAAQWLEVYFEGHGWIPLIEAPDQAKQSLEDDESLFDPGIVAADEVAVELYIPLKIETVKLLFQRIREQLLLALPYTAALLAGYLATPGVMKQWRRRKRRKWAESIGPRSQIAVEYAEYRDLAHDLNVGHPLDTPLEYLKKVVDDAEHAELAWLVSRSMYGDMARTATDADAQAAEELSASLRRRMFRAQPFQSRMLAVLSKASLRQPYTEEVPNVVLLDPVGRWSAWRRRRRRVRQRRRMGRRLPARVALGVRRLPAIVGRR